MCAPSRFKWFSKFKSMTIEDLMEEFRSSGEVKVFINRDTGMMIQPTNKYMDDGYGESEHTVPCEAEEVIIRKEDMEETEVEEMFRLMTFQPGHRPEIDMTGDKEIFEVGTRIECDCALMYDWTLKDKRIGSFNREDASDIYWTNRWKQSEWEEENRATKKIVQYFEKCNNVGNLLGIIKLIKKLKDTNKITLNSSFNTFKREWIKAKRRMHIYHHFYERRNNRFVRVG